MKLYIGIDWSSKKHDVCFMNPQGGVIQQIEIEHTQAGLYEIEKVRKKLEIALEDCSAGIETSRNLIIEFLLNQGYQRIYVLAPHLMKGNRSRYAASGGHNDASDAMLIAEILRTDCGRLIPWEPDLLITRKIRAYVNLLDFLTLDKVRYSNRLWDVLQQYYPQTTRIFSSIDTKVNLHFILAYPNEEAAKKLSFAEFKAFCKKHRYTKTSCLPGCYNRLWDDYPKVNPDTALIYQNEALVLADMLLKIIKAHEIAQKQLNPLFKQHPDFEIYDSLPGTGEFLKPALLAKMGDNRARFPTAQVLQATAGSSPYTDSSGKRTKIYFRNACDHQFRYHLQLWAKQSVRTVPWALTYFESGLFRSRSRSLAYRRLGNRWLKILWRLWMDRVPYDEALHLKDVSKFAHKK